MVSRRMVQGPGLRPSWQVDETCWHHLDGAAARPPRARWRVCARAGSGRCL